MLHKLRHVAGLLLSPLCASPPTPRSFAQVGCHPTDYEVLQAPLEGRLYFAGEGYSRYRYGFTHGALLSGQEAAQSIAAHARV